MRLSNLTKIISLSVGILTLAGCGSESSVDNTLQEPTTPEASDPQAQPPVAIEFPIQTETPQSFVLNGTGAILTSTSGLSLYTFDNDSDGLSNCNGTDGDVAGSTTDGSSCAGRWPPLLADDASVDSGTFTIIDRADGTRQWAYNHAPLYTFADDTAQGDVLGDNVGEVWHLARPNPVVNGILQGSTGFVGNNTVHTASIVSDILETSRIDKTGFALYIFDVDPVAQAACYDLNDGGCINAWPPLLADTGAKPTYPLSVVELDNGLMQWAYRSKPLYFFAGDIEAGETNGQGAGGVWHLATEVPALFRGEEGDGILSATGMVSALLPDSNNELVATQTDKDQFTLYTFDNDTAGQSNCAGDCALAWPPFLAVEGDVANGNFNTIAREDGAMQWTWNGSPLYFFAGDQEAGQINGDGINGVWHIISEAAPSDDEPAGITEISVISTALGDVLVGSNASAGDFQLYTFENDALNSSQCNDDCAAAWPPLLATESDIAEAPFSLIARDNGDLQWSINGKALYFYGGDTAVNQQNGEGLGDAWFVARPAPLRIFSHETKGEMLVATHTVLESVGNSSGQLNQLTLYTFDEDVLDSGESACFGNCADVWPPLYATSLEDSFGNYGVISRTEDDGSNTFQWTYKGLPLYFFIGDQQLGDTGGDYPTWQIARP